MKSFFIVTLFAILNSFLGAPQAQPRQSPAVTAAQVNGVYKYLHNDFRVLALGDNKLKVQFNGEWMTRGGYPNIGEAIGEAAIVGNVASSSSRKASMPSAALAIT